MALWIGKAKGYGLCYIGRAKKYVRMRLNLEDCSPRNAEDYPSTICVSEFEKITGIKLEDGEIRKIKTIKIELE